MDLSEHVSILLISNAHQYQQNEIPMEQSVFAEATRICNCRRAVLPLRIRLSRTTATSAPEPVYRR